MSRWVVAALLVAAVGCGCSGVIGEPLPCKGCELIGFGDAPSCTHTVTTAIDPTQSWQPTGPSGGRVSAVLALPGVVLVGTGYARGFGVISGRGGSIFRSVDQGKSYTPVLRVPGSTVNALVAAGARVYAAVASLSGSAQDGIYVSADDGLTFSPDNAGLFPMARVHTLAVATGSPERLYALIDGSAAGPLDAVATLYRREAGAIWTQAAMGGVSPLLGGPVLALVADAQGRDRLYAADGAQFYASADQGESFSVVASGAALWGAAAGANVTFLAADRADANHLLLGTRDDGLRESTNQGAAWQQLTSATAIEAVWLASARTWIGTRDQGLQAGPAGGVKRVGLCLIDPSVTAVTTLADANEVVIAGTTGNAYLSTNGGASFAPSTGLDELLGRVTTAGDSVWLMSAAGLYRTSDGGKQWSRVAPGVGTISFSDVAIDPADPSHLWLSTDGELFEGSSPGLGLISFHTNDGSFSRPAGLSQSVGAVAVGVPGTVYAYQRKSVEDVGSQPVKTGVFVSTDSGQTFSASTVLSAPLALTATWRFSPMVVAPNGALLAGVVNNPGNVPALERVNSAATEVWTAPAAWVPHGVHVAKTGAIYLVGRGGTVGILQSTDDGATFNEHDTGLGGVALQTFHLAFGPNGGLAVATQAGVHYAPDGASFSELTGLGSPAPIAWSVAIAATPSPTVIATTNSGVFRRLLP